jgi:hypothetical protein
VAVLELPRSGSPAVIYRRQFVGGSVTLSENGFTVCEPWYSEGEPNCCPSQERVSTFKRKGAGYEMVETRLREKAR